MKLEEARKHKNLFRSSLNNIKRKDINQMNKKVYYKILKCFRKHEKQLSNFLTIILQLHLRLNIKQFMKRDIRQT